MFRIFTYFSLIFKLLFSLHHFNQYFFNIAYIIKDKNHKEMLAKVLRQSKALVTQIKGT